MDTMEYYLKCYQDGATDEAFNRCMNAFNLSVDIAISRSILKSAFERLHNQELHDTLQQLV